MDTEIKFPPCFGSRVDYERWLDTHTNDALPASHCTDCLPSYKVRMCKVGRCEHPETVFRFTYEESFDPGEGGLAIAGSWKQTRAFVPIVKEKVKAKRAKPNPPKPRTVRLSKDEERRAEREQFWRERERQMRERLSLQWRK